MRNRSIRREQSKKDWRKGKSKRKNRISFVEFWRKILTDRQN